MIAAAVSGATCIVALASSVRAAVYAGTVLYNTDPVVPSGYNGTAESVDCVVGSAVVGAAIVNSTYNAAMISNGGATLVNLNPAGAVSSGAVSITGNQQYGSATFPVDTPFGPEYYSHAIVWSGSAASAVDLTPPGIIRSNAYAGAGNQQVGSVFNSITGQTMACLWNGSAGTYVNLNPFGFYNGVIYPEFFSSTAAATDGAHQVGAGNGVGGQPRALLWSGTVDSVVSLNPSGFDYSTALAVKGGEEVGYGGYLRNEQYNYHALLWKGSADSAVDLNPPGYLQSYAQATNGIIQVGHGGDLDHLSVALLWTGTAASAVNLQALLPSDGVWQTSQAVSIDDAGNIFGTADGTYNGVTGTFAVEWLADSVPEPTAAGVMLAAGAIALRRRAQRTE